MEDGSLYPSIYMKIHGQPCLFIRNFRKTRASNSIPATYGRLAFFNGVLQSHLVPAHQGSNSPTVPPTPSKSVRAPPKKGNAMSPSFWYLLWVSSMMASAPVNRVMLLMQCQNEMIKSGRLCHSYKGFGNCLARTVRNEGIISLWKGNTARMMGFMTDKVPRTYFSKCFMSLFNYNEDKDSLDKQLAKLVVAETLSRAITLVWLHPLEYARTRMACDIGTKTIVGKRQFNGIIDVIRKTLKSDGVAGLYRGCNLAYVAHFVSDWTVLVLKQNLPLGMLGLQQRSFLAGIIKVYGVPPFVRLIMHPANTLVRRMMMRSGQVIKYKSSFDAFSQIIKNEGVGSFYRGASASVIEYAVLVGIPTIFLIKFYKDLSAGRSDKPTYSIDIKWKNGADDGQRSR